MSCHWVQSVWWCFGSDLWSFCISQVLKAAEFDATLSLVVDPVEELNKLGMKIGGKVRFVEVPCLALYTTLIATAFGAQV